MQNQLARLLSVGVGQPFLFSPRKISGVVFFLLLIGGKMMLWKLSVGPKLADFS